MSWKPIVVGVDEAPESGAAAVLGWRLAATTGTSCRLVHAVRDVGTSVAAALMGTKARDLEQALTAIVGSRLRAALKECLPPPALDTLVIRIGRPAVVLNAEVERLGAGLVILGGKRHTALGRWLSGSTAHDAVRTLSVPVLVTRGAPAALRRVLVAVDLSYAAQWAIAEAERFATLPDAHLRAIHVLEPLPISDVPVLIDQNTFEANSEAVLLREIWPLLRVPRAEMAVRHGEARETLSAETADWKADLLVVGSHGKGWVDRLLLGSVTERLLNHLPTSLLMVPVPGPEALRIAPAKVEEAHVGTASDLTPV